MGSEERSFDILSDVKNFVNSLDQEGKPAEVRDTNQTSIVLPYDHAFNILSVLLTESEERTEKGIVEPLVEGTNLDIASTLYTKFLRSMDAVKDDGQPPRMQLSPYEASKIKLWLENDTFRGEAKDRMVKRVRNDGSKHVLDEAFLASRQAQYPGMLDRFWDRLKKIQKNE